MVGEYGRLAGVLVGAGILAIGASSMASATTYDLTTDWSNVSNPNGPWSLNQGSMPLPLVSNYTAGGTSPIPAQPAGGPVWQRRGFLASIFEGASDRGWL